MNQKENEEIVRTKLSGEKREYFRAGLGIFFLGTLGLVGTGISYCTNKSIDPELESQYRNCQYFLDQTHSEESKKFVYDDIFVINGSYQGKTCREIFQEYNEAKKKNR